MVISLRTSTPIAALPGEERRDSAVLDERLQPDEKLAPRERGRPETRVTLGPAGVREPDGARRVVRRDGPGDRRVRPMGREITDSSVGRTCGPFNILSYHQFCITDMDEWNFGGRNRNY